MTNDMTGKIALITGAAGAIGLAAAKLLAARGATIAAMDTKGADFVPLRVAIPMQPYGTTKEVAGLVGFLASDDAGSINGGAYPVDGGLTAG